MIAPPPTDKQKAVIKFLRGFSGECKYDFQAWGDCDPATGKKNRTGVLRRALMDATCASTVTATKPCGRTPKLQGNGGGGGQLQGEMLRFWLIG